MFTENERRDVRKAMAFDLMQIFRAEPGKTYTLEEIEKLLVAYVQGND
ncbi:hypothetical protein [Acutalibacter sp. 1XD8-36]|nr:hypothetical protein [Acutalibacter sp. 1XD8-36]